MPRTARGQYRLFGGTDDSRPSRQRVEAGPFLKWAGGKKQLLKQYSPYFPETWRTYFEPFLGGGAVFFHLQPSAAVLSDITEELTNAYTVVRDRVEELIAALGVHRNERHYYYSVRAWRPETLTPVERAARLIFLNRTCFNGLYRVNSKGQFNVPFGRYSNPTICDQTGLRAASLALRGVEICAADFEEALDRAETGDFAYLDPPYNPLSTTSSFTAYAQGGFSENAQRRLASVYKRMDSRGVMLMLSNSASELVRGLYSGFRVVEVTARRAINSKAEGRGRIPELLILNYEPPNPGDGDDTESEVPQS
jgi:DNA adenine methylase